MTQQSIDQALEVALHSLPSCLTEVLPQLHVVLDGETGSFEHAKSEIFGMDERIVEVGKWIKAARSVADAANAESLAILKTVGSTPKDVLKAKAKQRGALEDIETFKSVIADVEINKKHWELKAHQAANAVRSARDAVRNSAIASLKESLPGVLPPELFMLVQLIREIAASGDSTEFNTHPFIKTPLEFALREVSMIITGAVPDKLSDLGMSAILPPLPSCLSDFGKSPISMQKLADELAHEGAAL
jgi:hypothetical protein